jgi:mannose-6-phosphate isomerase-like protein (cupin superfamily)
MKNLETYYDSGILESYVMGWATPQEAKEVEDMAAAHIEVRKKINEINETLEEYALAHAIEPDVTVKPFLMATIDYTERMKNGEQPSLPPGLHEASQISDYAAWLNRDDMVLPDDFKDLYAKIIGYTPSSLTAIVWIKDLAPQEVHHDEFEKFLIVEGTCTITIGDEVHNLVPGNFLSIPLYKNHTVTVTSLIPCKIILQRIAA